MLIICEGGILITWNILTEAGSCQRLQDLLVTLTVIISRRNYQGKGYNQELANHLIYLKTRYGQHDTKGTRNRHCQCIKSIEGGRSFPFKFSYGNHQIWNARKVTERVKTTTIMAGIFFGTDAENRV